MLRFFILRFVILRFVIFRFAARTAVIAALTAVLPALASAACKPSDRSIAGVYQLRGVMETGSIIMLAPDGRFRYMLSVGAYDERAEGCWTRKGRTVSLISTRMLTSRGGKKWRSLSLQRNAAGNLLRAFGRGKPARYVRVRVWK
ncbi:MAG: hypothetical protein KDJ29_19315 [Hyphomicrobiales bacterium]|nr:hypothetical protein [Hyphomicrobiales bacterium]